MGGFGAGLILGLLGGGFRGRCCCTPFMPMNLPVSVCDTSYVGSATLRYQANFMDSRARLSQIPFSQYTTGYAMPMQMPGFWQLSSREELDAYYKNYWKSLGLSIDGNGNSDDKKEADNDGDGNVSIEEESRFNEMQEEFKTLYRVLASYYATNAKSKFSSELDTVLSKLGSKTSATKEDYTTLKNTYLKISKSAEGTQLRKIFAAGEIDANITYKTELEKAGFKFTGSAYGYKNLDDAALEAKLNEIELEINGLNGTSEYSMPKFDALFGPTVEDSNSDILRIISYWNDTRNDDDKRSIIRFVNTKVPKKGPECKYAIENNVIKLANSLTNKATILKSEIEGSASDAIAAQIASVQGAVKAVQDTFTNVKPEKIERNDAKLNELANEFEKLYKLCRLVEAQRLNEELKTKFGFINEFSEEDKDIIASDAIVADTNADLEAEGLKDVVIDADIRIDTDGEVDNDGNVDGSNEGGNNAPIRRPAVVPSGVSAKVKTLISEGCLVSTGKKFDGIEIYELADIMGDNSLYAIIDGKLVQIEGIELKDGKYQLSEGVTEATTSAVNPSSLEKKYRDALDGSTADEREVEAESYRLTTEQIEAAQTIGTNLWSLLDGRTFNDTDMPEVIRIIDDEVNSDNIMVILETFDQKAVGGVAKQWFNRNMRTVGVKITQGFFEHMLREWGTNGENQKCVQKMLGYVVEHAEARKEAIPPSLKEKFEKYIEELKGYVNKENLVGRTDGRKIDQIAGNIKKLLWDNDIK